MMSTNTQKHFRWVVESAAALIIVGVGLNFLVMHTLGSFDAASVILALFLGFWAFVLGNTVLFFSSIWLFMKRRDMTAEPASRRPQAHEQLKGVTYVLPQSAVPR
jgi:membrane protein implicated in regulation of membrane protease activity